MATVFTLCALLAGETGIPRGPGQFTVEIHDVRMDVFTYKPKGFTDGPMLMVFHGVLRNAAEYRDHARALSERHHALIVAPRFPEPEFPKERYQFGGVSVNGHVKPASYWSGSFLPGIVAEVRRREGRPKMPTFCIGHSGGGQFLARMAAFAPLGAERIVVANAGTHLFPTRELPYPFGFGGLPESLSDDAALERYLAQPITFFQGLDDQERDEYFDVTPPAEKQGRTRLERGRNVYAAGHELAKQRGWQCRWTLVEAKGVGHDHEKMFGSPACDEALLGASFKKLAPSP